MAKIKSPKIILLLTCIVALAVAVSRALKAEEQAQKERVNPDALLVQDFEKRVSEYLKLHKAIAAKLPALKPTASAARIAHRKHELAENIRKTRKGTRQGNIFTPEISAEFHRLIDMTMHGQDGAHIHTSLKHAEPVRLRIRVNAAYPDRVPLQTMPPTLLLNLPKLPEEVAYRVVGNNLVLLDVNTNLIIDFLPGAIP